MKTILLSFTVLILNVVAHSQSIKGKLADPADNKPLVGATVSLAPIKDSNAELYAARF